VQRALIVIPTYNEAENLIPLVDAIQALGCGFEILIVDENSPNGGSKIADWLANKRNGVAAIYRPDRMGLGPVGTSTSSAFLAKGKRHHSYGESRAPQCALGPNSPEYGFSTS